MSLNPYGEPQQQAKAKLIGSYFSKTEIDEARTVDNPVEFLRKKIIDERRVYGDANELSVVITGTGQVAIWLRKRGKEPAYVIKPKQLAQEVVNTYLKKEEQ